MVEKKVLDIIELMDVILGDTSVPKNIRKAVSDAKEKLKAENDLSGRISSAVYALDSVSEDINMPMHARTQIWAVLSALEAIKRE